MKNTEINLCQSNIQIDVVCFRCDFNIIQVFFYEFPLNICHYYFHKALCAQAQKLNIHKKILVAEKKINNNNNNCKIQGRTLRVRYMNFYYAERHVCNPFLCPIVTFTRLPIKTL